MSDPERSTPACSCETATPACPSCKALAERVAELEAELVRARSEPQSHAPFALKALRLLARGWAEGWGLRPSPARRQWMTEAPHAYKCLPLVVANQWGWQVLCPTDVRVTWDGSPDKEGLRVEVDPQYTMAVKSQFGGGIVTFSPPWLFRTSPGWDLYVKGPSNRWKPNCVPLEGVIETWWLNYTFTLNWKLVDPGTVWFARGESLGQLVPVPHATFVGSSAVDVPIETAEPEAAAEMQRWAAERSRLAGERVNTHLLYRRAEQIDEHLVKVPVPPVQRAEICAPAPPACEG